MAFQSFLPCLSYFQYDTDRLVLDENDVVKNKQNELSKFKQQQERRSPGPQQRLPRPAQPHRGRRPPYQGCR